MHDLKKIFRPNLLQDINKKIESWGFLEDVPESVFLAVSYIELIQQEKLRVGEIVHMLFDGLEMSQIEDVLNSIPGDHRNKSLEYLANQLEVAINKDMVLALQRGILYLPDLSEFQIDKKIQDEDILEGLQEINACLVKNTSDRSMLMFGSYEAYRNASIAGRAQRMKNAVLNSIDENFDPIWGVTTLQAVDRCMDLQSKAVLEDSGSSTSDSVWNVNDRNEKETSKIFSKLIARALEVGATDVTIKPEIKSGATLLWRLHSHLIQADGTSHLSSRQMVELTRTLQIVSKANSTGTILRDPHDGQFLFRGSQGNECFIRASFIPVDMGRELSETISISLRLLPREEGSIDLKKINIPKVVRSALQEALYTEGLIILTGPTNSGKSTTIGGVVGLHEEMFGESKKRLSIEDPVERRLPGILQCSISQHLKSNSQDPFSDYLKGFFRHDPDFIWIGEIRQQSTAEACLRAATSGHLAVTTIHATDSLMAFKTMSDMVSDFQYLNLVQSLSVIVCQRLVGQICPQCSNEKRPPNENEIKIFKYMTRRLGREIEIPKEVPNRNIDGCDNCTGGFSGQLPICDVLEFPMELKKLLLDSGRGHIPLEINKWQRLTLLDSAMTLVDNGTVDFLDVLQKVG